jgi:hypothetical protein
MFSGLSSLRKAEKKEPTPQNKALQDYLKRQYGGGTAAAEDGPKRKKKKKFKQGPSAIAILDADITGLPPVSEAAAKPARPELDAADDSEGTGCCCCCCPVLLLLYCCAWALMHALSLIITVFATVLNNDMLQVRSRSSQTQRRQKRCASR